ncbi:MAG TPA: BTAD domain-containing putative transcriptional regulator, partial [Stackebrandtia sp.]|uniref:AfsR/SARP family transcriptional regulator n=1 Tax=Stackebrandtia sp. TaxID=2023065 RepID=UPI002D6BC3AC
MSEFRILGTVEAGEAGRDVDLGHAKQRAILAILLSEVNRPVTAEQLEFRAWGDSAPRGVRSTLYSYLSRLRAAVGGLCEIARRQGGYALLTEPENIDLFRFRSLVSSAKASTDDAVALRLWDEAVGLWRGPAFACLDLPWLDGRRTALEAERFAAVLDRNDLRLRGGGSDALLASLDAEVRLYPIHERLAAQYMLALYRHGQQTAALDHFRRLRSRLAEELGAEPGAALQRLHRRILRSDADLVLPEPPIHPEPPVSPASRPVPRQLPPVPASFSGREGELTTMDGMAAAPAAVLAISGAGGMGKSWLTLRWAHRNSGRFGDGQLYVNLRGFEPAAPPLPVGTALRTMLVGLGADPTAIPGDQDSQVGLYRSLVAGKRILVVLDNARDAAQVAPLLPGEPDCVTIVTSRRDLSALVTSHGARRLGLNTVDASQARAILASHLGERRLDAEPAATSELVASCEGLPLALGIVAARAAGHPDFPLSALADELGDARTRLDTLDSGELAASLRAVFAG